MRIKLKRFYFNEKCTIGYLSIDEVFECFTLEDKVREPGEKISGKTAIPNGRYKLIINHSPKYDKEMPILLDVPMFSGIRIHSGNVADDTAGCILVGQIASIANNEVLNSRLAYDFLFEKLKKSNYITIEITNEEFCPC